MQATTTKINGTIHREIFQAQHFFFAFLVELLFYYVRISAINEIIFGSKQKWNGITWYKVFKVQFHDYCYFIHKFKPICF